MKSLFRYTIAFMYVTSLLSDYRVHEAVYVSERKTVHLPDVPERRCPEFFPDRLSLSSLSDKSEVLSDRSDTRRKILSRGAREEAREDAGYLFVVHTIPSWDPVVGPGALREDGIIVVANLVSVFVSLFDVT